MLGRDAHRRNDFCAAGVICRCLLLPLLLLLLLLLLQDELNELLGQSLSEVDNEAVMAEFEALEEEALRQEVEGMPNAPTPTPVQQQAYKVGLQELSGCIKKRLRILCAVGHG